MRNLENAGDPREYTGGGEPLPDNSIVMCRIELRPLNAANGQYEKTSKDGKSDYLDLTLTVLGGEFKDRKVFTMITTRNAEGRGVQEGDEALKAIMETNAMMVRGVIYPNDLVIPDIPGTANTNWGILDKMVCAVRVGLVPERKAQDEAGNERTYRAKNNIKLWLSPRAAISAQEWAFARSSLNGPVQGQAQLPLERALAHALAPAPAPAPAYVQSPATGAVVNYGAPAPQQQQYAPAPQPQYHQPQQPTPPAPTGFQQPPAAVPQGGYAPNPAAPATHPGYNPHPAATPQGMYPPAGQPGTPGGAALPGMTTNAPPVGGPQTWGHG